jgi:hypothetical protein
MADEPNSNPRIPSKLGCGGLLLLVLSVPMTMTGLFTLLGTSDPARIGLFIGDEAYRIGRAWWLVLPLALGSILAVFRLAFGYRDWVPTLLCAIWFGIAIAFTIETSQFAFAAVTGLTTWLIASGTWADRQRLGGLSD